MLNNSISYTCLLDPENFDDLVFIEGDVLVTKEQAAIYHKSGWGGLVKSTTWNPSENAKKWGKQIPYKMSIQIVDDENFEGKEIEKNLVDSIKEIESKTCLKFIAKKSTDTQFLHFKRSTFG